MFLTSDLSVVLYFSIHLENHSSLYHTVFTNQVSRVSTFSFISSVINANSSKGRFSISSLY
ncbi:MAG: hypothetical protein P1U46_04800 [Patescibacteria group bacterium]|nr:hypothetical protein [Patescibacteria group bacterium]